VIERAKRRERQKRQKGTPTSKKEKGNVEKTPRKWTNTSKEPEVESGASKK